MPFFFIVPLWLLCLVAGGVLLFSKRLRVLSLYLVMGSTGGVIVSFLLSLGVLLLAGKFLGGTRFAWVALIGYLIGIVGGGTIGILGGGILARIVNRRVGWQT